jgi:protein-tyrosine-phosphatase
MRSLLARSGLDERVVVESAGTGGYHVGALPDRRARAAAQARGLDLSSRARQFGPDDWARCDYVLAMDQQNFDDLATSAPDPGARAKLRLTHIHRRERLYPTLTTVARRGLSRCSICVKLRARAYWPTLDVSTRCSEVTRI